jgi:hypothetical protein
MRSLRNLVVGLSLGIIGVMLADPAAALVMCGRKTGTGQLAPGSMVKLRDACKTNEVQVDPVALGLQGPPGTPGLRAREQGSRTPRVQSSARRSSTAQPSRPSSRPVAPDTESTRAIRTSGQPGPSSIRRPTARPSPWSPGHNWLRSHLRRWSGAAGRWILVADALQRGALLLA